MSGPDVLCRDELETGFPAAGIPLERVSFHWSHQSVYLPRESRDDALRVDELTNRFHFGGTCSRQRAT